MKRLFLDSLYCLVGLALLPLVLYRRWVHGRYRDGWTERFGHLPPDDPDRPRIWLHAVSLGEVNAARSLVAQLQEHCPEVDLLITTTTDTGLARARRLFGERHHVAVMPFDLSWVIRRAFARARPALCLLMELEVWPQFIHEAARRGIPVVVVNGRISDRSFRWYRRVRPWLAPTFARLTRVLAQTDTYAQRFRFLGCPADRVEVTGSLKYDTAEFGPRVAGSDTLARRLALDDRPLWVAGGTGPGEETIILDAFTRLRRAAATAACRLAIVPRKPERFDAVAELIERAGWPLVRYSALKETDRALAVEQRDAVILGDTLGDLRAFFSLAAVTFVGRSLVPMGGSDMIEAAALGKPTLFGPHTFNFRQTVEALLAADAALLVRDADELAAAVTRCLTDPATAQALGQRAQQVIRSQQGTTAKTLAVVQSLLRSRSTPDDPRN